MKTLKRTLLTVLVLLISAGTAGWFSLDKETRGLLATFPTNRNLLFWNQTQRDAAFRAMDRIALLAKWHTAQPAATPRTLPQGAPLDLGIDLDAYLRSQHSAAVLVMHKGMLRVERYGLGLDASGRWTGFSVAKSFTSTLVGAAIKDGYIHSMDDKVSRYLPDMRGSAYDDVSIRQLLTMTSGVAWNENYDDPQSDVARFNNHVPEPGVDALVSYMRKLPRAAPPGVRWHYSTGETNLVGVMLMAAIKKPLAQYLQEKIWQPAGMQQQATWLLSKTGKEISGCCLQAAPRDFARMGQFILEGAMVDGQSIVPDDWLQQATHKQADIGNPGHGYGYQWWTYDDGSFAARGIFGQGIYIDPARQLVIVTLSDWAKAGSANNPQYEEREAFYRTVRKAVDHEAAQR
ncbi:MAG: serine hydrolase [Comamonadaceae bacterium]|nr:beta-lactamase family protein [Burkholderiales bacterium]MEB2348330.1 serine hydrolase [Comamonadaceae bacterium]